MSKLPRNQLVTMLELQSKLNSIVNANWLAANQAFLRAVFIESAEAIEHYGWKWWKKQTPNLGQVQIELIDILHFYLSDVLVQSGGVISTAADLIEQELSSTEFFVLFDSHNYNPKKMSINEMLELIAGLATVRRRSFALLQEVMSSCGMNWDSTFRQYLSKNVLNIFRQDNGYKDGTYIKIWNDREDNEYLADFMVDIDYSTPSLADDLYFKLEGFYKKL